MLELEESVAERSRRIAQLKEDIPQKESELESITAVQQAHREGLIRTHTTLTQDVNRLTAENDAMQVSMAQGGRLTIWPCLLNIIMTCSDSITEQFHPPPRRKCTTFERRNIYRKCE